MGVIHYSVWFEFELHLTDNVEKKYCNSHLLQTEYWISRFYSRLSVGSYLVNLAAKNKFTCPKPRCVPGSAYKKSSEHHLLYRKAKQELEISTVWIMAKKPKLKRHVVLWAQFEQF